MAVVAAVLAVGASVSACTDHVGAGAVVGSETISESHIQDQAAQVIAQTPQADDLTTADQIRLSRAVATTAVRHALIQQVAQAQGLVINEAEINAALTQIGTQVSDTAASLGVPQSDLGNYIRDYTTLNQLMQKQGSGAAVDNVAVTIDYVVVSSRDAAIDARSKYLSNPAAMAADIAASPPDASGNATAGSNQKIEMLTSPADLWATGLFAAKPGDLMLIAGQQDSYLVIKVLDRAQQPSPLTAESIPSDSGPAGAVAVLSLLLAPYAQQAGVTVNPRYGRWDPSTMQVVPGDSGI